MKLKKSKKAKKAKKMLNQILRLLVKQTLKKIKNQKKPQIHFTSILGNSLVLRTKNNNNPSFMRSLKYKSALDRLQK